MSSREKLLGSTTIGNELLAMGLVTKAQLAHASTEFNKAIDAGRSVRFGDVLLELRYVTAAALTVAEQRQAGNRETLPDNMQDTKDALAVLRNVSRAYHRSTEPSMPAVNPRTGD